MPTCEMCGRTLRLAVRGRPPRYCSRACRARAYRLRVADRSATDPHAGGQAEGRAEGQAGGQDGGQAESQAGGRAESQAESEGQGQGVPGAATRADPGADARRMPESTESGLSEGPLDQPLIVRTAIELADRDGVAAVSMRRVATELGVGVMSLYRYVASREELNDLMVDTVFGERPLPEPGPDGWRAKLELSAREEWALYRDHPWVSHLVAVTTRPPIAPSLMAYTDWRMRALDGHRLDFATMVQIAIMIGTYLQSAAMPLAHEAQAARATRNTRQQWADARQDALHRTLRTAHLPMVSEFGTEAFQASEPENIFEFGLHRMLDGVATLLDAAKAAGDAPAVSPAGPGDGGSGIDEI
ncbi:TetR/AcrR family transcriptional regulator [Streptosporangium canum]|uniref:TetR/AcrR family transcriptional regulator n=1 Tax=Streptosporangium canum TaxID=324952 RepID=UPI003429560B